jgi:translation elongation factor EF-Ts
VCEGIEVTAYNRVLIKLSGEVFGGGRVGVDPDVVSKVAKEREIAEATAREEGKPEGALPKIIEGRLNGFFKEVALLDQPSVTESKKSVKAVLDAAGVTVTRFARFEVGA